MALPRQKSDGLVRLLVAALAVGIFATAGLVAIPSARAAFAVNGLQVAPSKYWGGMTFVPGETMSITIRTTAEDTMDLVIHDLSGSPSYPLPGIVMPATLLKTITFTIPMTLWPDANSYEVRVTDTTSGQVRAVPFAIEQYRFSVWSNRFGYLAGDSVSVSWSAVYAQNGTPAPVGVGAIEVVDGAGASLLSTPQYDFTQSQGTLTFTLGTGITTPDFETIYGWFNDTSGARHSADTSGFGVGNLGVTVTVQLPGRGYFEPGEPVPVTVRSTITGIGGGVLEPNVAVSVNVTDQATGSVVAAYSNTALTTDATGVLNYVFQLGQTPASGTYQVTATDTAYGSIATASAPPFDVRPPPAFTATVTLDKLQYLSGDTIHATANVVAIGTQSFTYSWAIYDSSGNVLAFQAGGATTYAYDTSASYQGLVQVQVRVDNGTGGVVYAVATAQVAFGYLSLTLDRTQFNPGDTITATVSLSSSLITNPTYAWVVQDASGSAVAAGSTASSSATYTTPNPASSRYTFIVTASQNGRTVQASRTAYRNDGYYLSISLDKSSYNPGDTMTITYTVTALGAAALPSSYRFYVQLFGVAFRYIDAGSATGVLTMQVPGNAPTGNLLLAVQEFNTGAYVYNIVHVGAVNPLVADVGGVPLFDILITLLFVVLLLAVILLWRRTGMGRGPGIVETGRPSTPPPPPPSGPSQQSAGPMSVACKHCGASIEITTSKRPIEVMCPSCGETQVVQ